MLTKLVKINLYLQYYYNFYWSLNLKNYIYNQQYIWLRSFLNYYCNWFLIYNRFLAKYINLKFNTLLCAYQFALLYTFTNLIYILQLFDYFLIFLRLNKYLIIIIFYFRRIKFNNSQFIYKKLKSLRSILIRC